MVKEGLFERFPANEVYALHNWPGLPAGQMAVRAGPGDGGDRRDRRSRCAGSGGHGAMPHLAVDPVVAAAQVITALQTIASRNVEPVDAVVVSICSMQTSQIGAFNVIPGRRASWSARCARFRPQTRDLAEQRIAAKSSPRSPRRWAAPPRSTTRRGYPATVNSEREAEFAARVGERVFGKGNVITEHEPTMGGEDFSYMLQARPGAYVFLGQGGGAAAVCFLHNPQLRFQRRGDSRSAPATWPRWWRKRCRSNREDEEDT